MIIDTVTNVPLPIIIITYIMLNLNTVHMEYYKMHFCML